VSTSTAPGGDSKTTGAAPRNIFEDPAIADAAKTDPVVRFMSTYWKPVMGALIAVALGMIAYNKIKETSAQKRAAATQTFNELREQYNTMVTKQEEAKTLERALSSKTGSEKDDSAKKIDELKKETEQLWEKVKLRADALESPAPFDILGRLYKGMAAARMNDYDAAESALIKTPWEISGRPGSGERMVAELATLGLARSLLDSEKHSVAAKGALKGLAERGDFAAVGAVSSLASVVSTDEEKKAVRDLAEKIKSRLPAQEKFLSEATERVA